MACSSLESPQGMKSGEIGLAASAVDLVLLTHLHPEHIGGLVTAKGKPVFTNARVVSCRTEWRWWNQNDRPAGLPEGYLRFVPLARAATRPYEQAARLRTFSGTETVSDGIVGFPALGHTPGHSLYEFTEGRTVVLQLKTKIARRRTIMNSGRRPFQE